MNEASEPAQYMLIEQGSIDYSSSYAFTKVYKNEEGYLIVETGCNAAGQNLREAFEQFFQELQERVDEVLAMDDYLKLVSQPEPLQPFVNGQPMASPTQATKNAREAISSLLGKGPDSWTSRRAWLYGADAVPRPSFIGPTTMTSPS